MNAWVQQLGLDALKPLLTALVLPPVPWLVLMLLGGWLLGRQWRSTGWALLLAGAALGWASGTSAAADAAAHWLLDAPPAITSAELAGPGPERAVIVVLGGGRIAAPEYPGGTLSPITIERLRYGVWLSRATGLPLAFSGGLSPGATPGASEGELARRIAVEEFRRPLAWVESRSRDTRENALFTVELLRSRPALERLVLVTHDLHMPRALRHFERARDAAGLQFAITPAPVGRSRRDDDWALSDFYPTADGLMRLRYALREWLGIMAGA